MVMPKCPVKKGASSPVVQVSSNSVEWPSMTARPDAAATVAEGAAKPQSTMAMQLRTTPTQVIAHWVAASRQVLDDAPQLRDLIDTELRYGLALVEETQLLSGDGTSPNLHGLIPQATAFNDPLTGQIASPNQIDRIGSAILQSALADFPPTGIVLHPSDWQRMRMLKDGEGRYILGAPGAEVDPVLFGLPVVATKAIAAGSFLVGNFQEAATLYDRWAPRVEISTEHADFFVRNLVAILAEQRIAVAVRRRATSGPDDTFLPPVRARRAGGLGRLGMGFFLWFRLGQKTPSPAGQEAKGWQLSSPPHPVVMRATPAEVLSGCALWRFTHSPVTGMLWRVGLRRVHPDLS
ncbi:phage major capsid protein [Rhodovulum steppense]|uniref:HK97 family phage major capsid protein n=1 Tax=Rhodovulum steppense TaxID=540251 RepID=A0A4R1YBB5_9RHOB|nr:phage major capsid protein [Rhodovulum steppense]TCM73230.1 HK97 family phage major capsid protein [Rhodovulum steppense]